MGKDLGMQIRARAKLSSKTTAVKIDLKKSLTPSDRWKVKNRQ